MKHLKPLLGCLSALAISLAGSASPAQTPPPKPGELGFQPPEVVDIVLADTVVHEDQIGGSYQALLALSGSKDKGFSAVWRDTRDGSLGLYFARLDGAGVALEEERSICLPHTMRRTDAVVALAPDGSGTIAWTVVLGRGAVPFLRCFDAAGMLLGGERRLADPVETGAGEAPRGGRGDDDASCRGPVIARHADGHNTIVWTRAGRIQCTELSFMGDPLAPTADLDATLPAAEGSVRIAAGPENVTAILWRARAGELQVTVRREKRNVTMSHGSGTPRAIVADPAGGYWILADDAGRTILRHAAADGRSDRAPITVSSGAAAEQQLAVFQGGVAVLERTSVEEVLGPPLVKLFDSSGAPRPGLPLAPVSEAARNIQDVKLAGSGDALLVAWTDERDGDLNVYSRLIHLAPPSDPVLGPERRLNSDEASATQNQPAIASSGTSGVIVWTDERALPSRIFLRRFSLAGPAEHELALPLAFADESPPSTEEGALRAAVAVRPNGDALVCWRSVAPGGISRLVGQIVASDGKARSRVLDLDDGTSGLPGDIACTALSFDRGFVVAWPRARGGVQCRRVSPVGELGAAQRLSEGSEGIEADVDVRELDGGRVLCAWTAHRPPTTWSIRARYLTQDGSLLGDELAFENTGRDGDWDPALAAVEGGGFVMSWTSGSPRDYVRDVVVRMFDGRARPKGPILTVCFAANEQDFSDIARLADGSFVVAWEDDISYVDQVYARRLSRDGRTLGPMTRLNSLESKFVADRVAPRVAACGEGFAAVFADRHRSLGFDALVKIVGPSFDDVPESRMDPAGR